MQAESMMIDPNELVIDLPVDEANVRVKMESLQTSGLIQPVAVWLQDRRIIDGFHRTVAAQRLGWKGIPCYVVDCDEGAFWDARIQSARQHHSIEEDRLQTWIRECWSNSDWPDVIAVMKDGQLRASNPDVIDVFMSNMKGFTAIHPMNRFERWLVEDRKLVHWAELAQLSDKELLALKGMDKTRLSNWRKKQQDAELCLSIDATNPLCHIFKDYPDDDDESVSIGLLIAGYSKGDIATDLSAWFQHKAKQWGVSLQWLLDSILTHVGARPNVISNVISIMNGIVDMPTAADAAALGLALHIGDYTTTDTEVEIRQYLRNRGKGESFSQYKNRREREERKAVKDQGREQRLAESQKRTDADREDDRRRYEEQQRYHFKQQIEEAKGNIRSCGFSLGFTPDAPAMLANFAQFVADFTAEHFPDVQVATPNPVALENSRLRAENAKLKERIASLERALGSKESAGPMIASAMAWSSTDFQQ